jgi:hypothetical protein
MARHGRKLAGLLLALAALFFQRQPAVADVVVLTNGKSLEGRVTRDGDTIVIEMAQGSVRIPRDKVRSIEPKRTPLDEFAERRQAILQNQTTAKISLSDAAEEWFLLANWAAEQKLSRAREECLKNALAADSDHAGARRASGYVLQDGRWMTFMERYQALGFVLFEGHWVPHEAADEVRKLRKEQQR